MIAEIIRNWKGHMSRAGRDKYPVVEFETIDKVFIEISVRSANKGMRYLHFVQAE